MSSAIETSGLVKTYGTVRALDGLDLEVEEGKVHGFLGPNGAGKTTTIRILTGLLKPDQGVARIFGRDVTSGSGVRTNVGYMPELPSFPAHLTGRELLNIYGQLYGLGKSERESQADELLDLVGLENSGDRRIGGYSKGMQQRLGVAQSLLGDPDLVIMDEPTAGLDPEGRAEVREVVKQIGEEGETVFLSSHLLEEVEKVCTHVTIIHRGRGVVSGSVGEISRRVSEREEIVVEVDELGEKIINSVEKIPQVRGVNADGNELTVLTDIGTDIRREVSRTVFQAGGIIIGMREKKKSLEDVFLELTRGKGRKNERG
ncbi:hypothetical protein AKJ40_03055 [candidate division MSBL1 archaeon SCGC-AAA259M10]|uniref:ABC transporter domain-containing protein n=1 Tax=candidate division MSBL1 archaeon SCGC-AAA259M10 TaxID=1698270 RepID=A0A133UZ65_9EURY|nr:hypothetical protein AKJ40_03055 [candidate division MSBL1 archaeon SCGC-AAA259M10]